MEKSKSVDPTIRVRRVCGWQVDWLAGILNISKKHVVEVVTNDFIKNHEEEFAIRVRQVLGRPSLDD